MKCNKDSKKQTMQMANHMVIEADPKRITKKLNSMKSNVVC